MFERAPREVLAHVDALRVPFIILHGTDDPLVRVEASQRVYDGAPAPGRPARPPPVGQAV